MPFTGFTREDLLPYYRDQQDRITDRLAEFADAIIAWSSHNGAIATLCFEKHVTRKPDPQVQWVAILPEPVPPRGDVFDVLSRWPQFHLTLGESNNSLPGINIEFEEPRKIARRKLNNTHAAIEALKSAANAEIILRWKAVDKRNPRNYLWVPTDERFWNVVDGRSLRNYLSVLTEKRFWATEVTPEIIRSARDHVAPRNRRDGPDHWRFDPILLVTRQLRNGKATRPANDFMELNQKTSLGLAKFMRLLLE